MAVACCCACRKSLPGFASRSIVELCVPSVDPDRFSRWPGLWASAACRPGGVRSRRGGPTGSRGRLVRLLMAGTFGSHFALNDCRDQDEAAWLTPSHGEESDIEEPTYSAYAFSPCRLRRFGWAGGAYP